MIWLIWRQFRPQAIAAAIALAVMAILLAATGPGLAAQSTAAGLSACHANCATIASSFINSVGNFDHIVYFGSIALMYLVPALMGLFWGAPLIAREFEAGTHRIAWNQSVTRTRWTFVKLGIIGLAAVATAGLLSLMVTWWANPIDHAAVLTGGPVQVATGGGAGVHATWFVLARLEPVIFAAQGVAPLGYAAFAFALGRDRGRAAAADATRDGCDAGRVRGDPGRGAEPRPPAPAPARPCHGAAERPEREHRCQHEPRQPGERDPGHPGLRQAGRLGPVEHHHHPIGRAAHGAT
jgi:hypothetical protein